MCDTMVAVKNSTRNNIVLFAKNSDRDENEAHIMVKVEAKTHDLEKEPMVHTTNMSIPQVEKTYGVVLLKPEWLWGCEMGFNEHGLNIGNEAVFTKEKYESKGLLGMDIMRLVLERCKTAREGVDYIAWLLEEYGQGGNCKKPGHGKFTYHNSFILADKDTAWVLETAGKYWVAKEVKDIYSISNGLTITTDYDLSHPDVITNAVKKKYIKNVEKFNFAKAYEDKLISWFAKGKNRRNLSYSLLDKDNGDLTINKMKSILRYHPENFDSKEFESNTMKSICVHGGPGISSHTTGSYVAEISNEKNNYFVTGSSTPCISTFKPIHFESGMFFTEDNRKESIDYWLKREKIHRLILENKIDSNEYKEGTSKLEEEYDRLISSLDSNSSTEEYNNIVDKCFELEEAHINNYLLNEIDKGKIKGSIIFKKYWKRMNKDLENEKY